MLRLAPLPGLRRSRGCYHHGVLLRGITLVLHDFGGPAGMGLAARHPGRIRRVISANGPTPFGQADALQRLMANAAEAPWFQWIVKAEADGSLETVLGQRS